MRVYLGEERVDLQGADFRLTRTERVEIRQVINKALAEANDLGWERMPIFDDIGKDLWKELAKIVGIQTQQNRGTKSD